MNLFEHKSVYFLGIGGIGMSALARYFKHYGLDVAGYDKTPTTLTNELEDEGIEIHFDENIEYLEHHLSQFDKSSTLIIYTPAVPIDHAEFVWLEKHNYKMFKRAEILGEITKEFKTIAVAGTHGKTTTSSMVAHILKAAGVNCFAFLGGITKNYNTNLLLGEKSHDKETYIVVEADEYDRSFLTLHPHIAIVTSLDPDHLDIYGNLNYMIESYSLFCQQVSANGSLIVKKNVDNVLSSKARRYSYSVTLKADFEGTEIKVQDAEFLYNINSPLGSLVDVTLGIPGVHNIENSVAATAVAQLIGINNDTIKEALRSFHGVKRRFDYRVRQKNQIYIDDYAHHPEELRAAITAAKSLYPGKKVTGIFQPHLFTRTRDFADGFVETLSLLDEAILLDIYPAREKPIQGINSEMLLKRITSTKKILLKKEEVVEYLKKNKTEVLMTLGAGDIDTLVEPIEKCLLEMNK